MNRCRCVWVAPLLGVAGLSVGMFGGTPAARGQAVVSLPADILSAQKAPNAALFKPQITKFIDAQLAGLKSANPVAQRSARQALVEACPPTRNPATTSFYINYTALLATAVGPMLTPDQPLGQRISVGVVIEGVANRCGPAGQSKLTPVAVSMMADANAAVALWGAKAARPLVVDVMTQAGGPVSNQPLFKALVDAVANPQHKAFSGYIAVEAYAALLVDPRSNTAIRQANMPALYGPVLDLIEARTMQYHDGLAPVPEADDAMPTFISREFPVMQPAEQKRAMQVLLNFLDAVGARAPLIPPADGATLRSLKQTVKRTAEALTVMFGQVAGRPGSSPLVNIARLGIAATGPQIAKETALSYTNLTTGSAAVAKLLTQPPPLPPMSPPAPPGK